MKPKSGLEGQKFTRYTVLMVDKEETKRTGHMTYICRCDCGTIKSVRGTALLCGDAKSCGCLKNELSNKHNELILYDELGYGLGFFDKSDEHFIFNIRDVDVVKSRCWSFNGIYATTNRSKGYKGELSLHRAIAAKYEDIKYKIVDHMNHNTLDERMGINLRVCTKAQNNRNSRSRGTNTGEKHISFDPKTGKYRVYITYEGDREEKKFKEKQDAIAYRDNYFAEHSEIDEFRYKPEEDYVNNNEFIMTPYTYVNPKNLPIIDPFYYYPSIPEKPLINPFVIVDPDKFYNS